MNNNTSKEAFTPSPRITQEVLVYLDQMFPEQCAILGETSDSIFFRAGSRAVVRHLYRLYNEQESNQFNLE